MHSVMGAVDLILIIGGAYQGKLDYAVNEYEVGESDVWRCGAEAPDFSKKVAYGFHMFVLAKQREGIDVPAYVAKNIELFKDKIIISDDISCGVVPVETETRAWRENVGRCLAILMKNADEAVRVFCGLGVRLK